MTTITHSCGAMWTTTRAAHCAACHRTFGGVRGFERHRKNFTCVDPSTVGLVLIEQDHGDPLWCRQDIPILASGTRRVADEQTSQVPSTRPHPINAVSPRSGGLQSSEARQA